MSINVFPVAVSSSSNAFAFSAASPNVFYTASMALEAAIYTVTCASSTIVKIEFLSGASGNILVASAETVTGSITVNLPSSITTVRAWTNTGTNIVITITKIASAVSNSAFTGTLDTITSSGTYTGTSASGYGYAMVSGGGGGGAGFSAFDVGGGGGASGGASAKIVQLTGSMSVTIGASGAAGNRSFNGGTGGTTNFAGLTANGGGGGVGYGNNNGGSHGAGGNGTGGTWNATGNQGGGPSGNNSTGFTGASSVTANPGIVSAGYGYGFGGNGGSNSPNQIGNAGGAGVVYVLRF
jgi:hypothetical protein